MVRQQIYCIMRTDLLQNANRLTAECEQTKFCETSRTPPSNFFAVVLHPPLTLFAASSALPILPPQYGWCRTSTSTFGTASYPLPSRLHSQPAGMVRWGILRSIHVMLAYSEGGNFPLPPTQLPLHFTRCHELHGSFISSPCS